MKCKECYWDFHGDCVCEDKLVHSDATQYTKNCVGFINKDLENKVWNTYGECANLLKKCNLEQLLEIKSLILNWKRR